MLTGYLEPSRGTALVAGLDIRHSMPDIFPLMGVCPQVRCLPLTRDVSRTPRNARPCEGSNYPGSKELRINGSTLLMDLTSGSMDLWILPC